MVEKESLEPNNSDNTRNLNNEEENRASSPKELMERLGRTKKRILIELYRDSVGYKRLSKIIGVGLDTIRSHIRTGKYSRSLLELGLVERGEKGWQLTPLGLQITELLQQEAEFKAFFFE
jgi:predicted transcriptional regulator